MKITEQIRVLTPLTPPLSQIVATMRRKITTALLLQIEFTNRHQVRTRTVLLPNFPRLEASRVVQAPVFSTVWLQHRPLFSTVLSSARSSVFSTVQYVLNCSAPCSSAALTASCGGRAHCTAVLHLGGGFSVFNSIEIKFRTRLLFCKLSNLIPILQIR